MGRDVHALPLLTVDEGRVRKRALDETLEDDTAARAKSASCENVVRDVLRELVVAKEDDALSRDERVE